ncbi:hypothetical protein INR49_030208 [Caranx melampygus]|nr:hypothetical protein INR49_030208 [Caranx melampygus]
MSKFLWVLPADGQTLVCDLKCQGCSVTVFTADEVPHFIVDADAETAIDLVLLKEPPHCHQNEM